MRTAMWTGAAVLAAVTLAGCGGGGTGASQDPAPARSTPSPGGSPSGDAELAGTWKTKPGPDQVTLAFVHGTAVLNVGRKTACVGGAKTVGGHSVLVTTCTGGDHTRTTGTLRRRGHRLTITWRGGPTDSYTKTGDATRVPRLPHMQGLPSGLPDDAG